MVIWSNLPPLSLDVLVYSVSSLASPLSHQLGADLRGGELIRLLATSPFVETKNKDIEKDCDYGSRIKASTLERGRLSNCNILGAFSIYSAKPRYQPPQPPPPLPWKVLDPPLPVDIAREFVSLNLNTQSPKRGAVFEIWVREWRVCRSTSFAERSLMGTSLFVAETDGSQTKKCRVFITLKFYD